MEQSPHTEQREVSDPIREHLPPRHHEGHASRFPLKAAPRPKLHVGASQFLASQQVKHVTSSREAYCSPTRPIVRRGFALKGFEHLAPILVKSKGRPDPKAPLPRGMVNPSFRAQLAAEIQANQQREVTVPRERGMDGYRSMSQEERADWIYGREVAEFVPPQVTREPRWCMWPSRVPVY